MIIVNDLDSIPTTIFITTLDKFITGGVSQQFLNDITSHPVVNSGIKRKSYYILNTDTIIRHPNFDRQYQIYCRILELALKKGYKMIMVKF